MSKARDDVAGIGRQKTREWELYSFTASNEAFLGMTSSMKGSRPGYVSSSFWRRPRCTEDFTLDRLLGGILDGARMLAGVFDNLFEQDLSHGRCVVLNGALHSSCSLSRSSNRERYVLPLGRQEAPNNPLG